jgi:transmembrane sensor
VDNNKIKKLFEQYQSGKISSDEQRLVEGWFAAFDNQQEEDLSEEQQAKIFTGIDREIDRLLENHPVKKIFPVRWVQVAAVLLIGVGIVWLGKSRRVAARPVGYTIISVPKGFKKQLSLPDGTTVFLNSGSSLRISSAFGVTNRVVLLSGEGFFMVKHNQTHPFTIQSGGLHITDIGTSFNVKAYAGENQIRVAVESGEVSVKEDSSAVSKWPALITRNQQLIYNKNSRQAILNHAQIDEISAWRTNRLRFDNASMGEIATTLERWYDVTIKLNGYTNNHRRYTVSFNNESLTNVLQVLEKLSGMSYQVNNKSIQINLKPSKKI